MHTLKLRSLLLLSFTAVLASMAIAAAIGISQLHRAVDVFDQEVRGAVELERKVLQMSLQFQGQVHEWKNTLLRGKDPARLDKYWGAFQQKEAAVREMAQALAASAGDPEARRAVADFAAAHRDMGQRYREGFKAFEAAHFDAGAGDAAVAGIDRMPTARLNELARLLADGSAAVAAAASARGRQAMVLSLVLMTAVAACGLGWSLLVARTVTRMLGGEPRDAAQAAHAIAHGDLTTQMKLRRNDAGSMMFSLLRMQESLAGLVARVQENADAVASASAEIAQGNSQLARSTGEQAAALEQTVGSVQALDAHVARNAEHAAQAHELAVNARHTAHHGGQAVTQMVSTMKAIDDSAQRIASINAVVDSIAFQTRMLALNAAVEAARAGDQGRGFAVVAGEVRTLAQKSAEAANEIRHLIADSVSRGRQGAALADQAAASMQEVYDATSRVAVITGEISDANQAQSEAVARLTAAMRAVDAGTQQNAAMVEEISASSENLRILSTDLFSLVSTFRLPGDTQPPAERGAETAPPLKEVQPLSTGLPA